MPIDPKDLADMKDFHDRNFSKDGESAWVIIPPLMPERLIAQAPAMYELLKEIELRQYDAYGESDYCSFCRSWVEHKRDCRLAAALKVVEEE